jgi:hypothetical protein
MPSDDLRKKMDAIKQKHKSSIRTTRPQRKKRKRTGLSPAMEFTEGPGGKWTTRLKAKVRRQLAGDRHKTRRTKQVEAAVKKAG